MVTDTRAAFEAFLRNREHFPKSPSAWTYQRDTVGNYCNNRVDDMWIGWQASAQAEREACAKLCELALPTGGRAWSAEQSACFDALTHVAQAIRDRGAP